MVRSVRRLLTMGPAEIAWRVKHGLTTHSERIAYLLNRYEWSPSAWERRLCQNTDGPPTTSLMADWWRVHMRNRDEPPFLLDNVSLCEVAPLYEQLFPGRLELLMREADLHC